MDWVGKSELLHRAPRLYTQVYSPGGNLKQNKHWRVTLEPRIARYRGTLLLPNMRGAHSRTRLDNNRHDRPGRCRWHSPVFLWCVDKNSKSLRFQRVSDHWALAGSTSAARVLHCRLWGLQPTDFCIRRSSPRRSSWWCLLPSSYWSPRWCLLGSPSGKVRNGGDAKSLHAARHPRAPARLHVRNLHHVVDPAGSQPLDRPDRRRSARTGPRGEERCELRQRLVARNIDYELGKLGGIAGTFAARHD